MKRSLYLCLLFALFTTAVAHAASPADMISDFRLQYGEKRVVTDPKLTRIAQEQAAAMAAKDTLDHNVLGDFSRRIGPAGAGRAAENIAYGYDSFSKTLNQWIDSSGHRQNLLLHDASRVGVASAKSKTSGRTYWAMAIAGDYESPKAVKRVAAAKPPQVQAAAKTKTCRIKILGLCI